ncbi:MAG: hypothetical protein GX653_09450 [Clostridiales bacterium]|nr:hypothetical protein [Clostridiales bacterium]
MKRMILLLLALMMAALPALAAPTEAIAPLSVDELHTFAGTLLERGIREGLTVASGEEGYMAEGEGYTLYLSSEDLSMDTVLIEAALTMDSTHEQGLVGPRGIAVTDTLSDVLSAYPNDNPVLAGTMTGAVLYISGALPGEVATGVVTRDGQDIKLVEQSVLQPTEGGYLRLGLQYVIDSGLVVALRYFSGGVLTEQEAQDAMTAIANLQEETSYFAYDTQDPQPLQREDMSFAGLDFFDMTPDIAQSVLGDAVHEEKVKDSTGEELRVMQWDGIEIAFVYGSGGQLKRADRITVTGAGVEGPRGLRVGTPLTIAMGRFQHPAEIPAEAGTLYGDAENQQPPYGRLDMNENSAQLNYVMEQDGEAVRLTASFLGGELVEMGATY